MEKTYCTNCGAVNWQSANFCTSCGQPLVKVSAKQQPMIPFRFRDLFSEVFKPHSKAEAEEILIAGTAKTTPPLATIKPFKLRPWLFSRALLFTLLLAVLLGILTTINGRIGNVVALDAVIAISVPVSGLVLFFEMNIYRNLSLYQIVQIFLVGGLLAIIVTILLDYIVGNQGPQNLIGALETGVTEEVGKLIVAAYFVYRLRTKQVLQGLLIGAAIGSGFAAFENIMYMVNDQTGALAPTNIALLRALISIGGHTEWCAIATAGLVMAWKQQAGATNRNAQLACLGYLLSVIALHTAWDWLGVTSWMVMGILIIVTWTMVFSLVQIGLKEANLMKLTARQ